MHVCDRIWSNINNFIFLSHFGCQISQNMTKQLKLQFAVLAKRIKTRLLLTQKQMCPYSPIVFDENRSKTEITSSKTVQSNCNNDIRI